MVVAGASGGVDLPRARGNAWLVIGLGKVGFLDSIGLGVLVGA